MAILRQIGESSYFNRVNLSDTSRLFAGHVSYSLSTPTRKQYPSWLQCDMAIQQFPKLPTNVAKLYAHYLTINQITNRRAKSIKYYLKILNLPGGKNNSVVSFPVRVSSANNAYRPNVLIFFFFFFFFLSK